MVDSANYLQDRINPIADSCRLVLEKRQDKRILAVYLYGSVLGQHWRADSDLDIAVLDEAEQRFSLNDGANLMDEFERATGCAVDLRFLRDCTLSHQVSVFSEGQLIYNRENSSMDEYVNSVLGEFSKNRSQLSSQWAATLNRLTKEPRVGK